MIASDTYMFTIWKLIVYAQLICVLEWKEQERGRIKPRGAGVPTKARNAMAGFQFVFAWIGCAALIGCGSVNEGSSAKDSAPSPTSLSCESFASCGGDLSGKWRVSKTCPTDQIKKKLIENEKLCDQASVEIGDVSTTGSLYFTDKSVVYDATFTIPFTTTLPQSCVSGDGSCEYVQNGLAATDSVTEAACETQAAGCSCTYKLSAANKTQHGYVAEGGSFVETDPTDGKSSTIEYCVQGSTLRLKEEDEIDVFTR